QRHAQTFAEQLCEAAKLPYRLRAEPQPQHAPKRDLILPLEQGEPPNPGLKNVGDSTTGDYQRQSPTQSDHACEELGGTGPVDQMDEEQNAKDGSERAEREAHSCQPVPRHGPRSRDSVRGGDTDSHFALLHRCFETSPSPLSNTRSFFPDGEHADLCRTTYRPQLATVKHQAALTAGPLMNARMSALITPVFVVIMPCGMPGDRKSTRLNSSH